MKTKRLVSFVLIFLLTVMLGNTANLYAEHNDRSVKKSAIIIGGSSAAGAVLGALMGGKKGAAAGAVAAGGGAAIYDHATRDNRGHYSERNKKNKALIIGGSSATGAAAGGIAGGKKGAVIGALIGAAGGYVLDRKTDRDRRIF